MTKKLTIYEGIDRVGKSTRIEKDRYYKGYNSITVASFPTSDFRKYYSGLEAYELYKGDIITLMSILKRLPKKHIVCDRFLFSTYVYHYDLAKDDDRLLHWIKRSMEGFDTKVIHMTLPYEEYLKRCTETEHSFYTKEVYELMEYRYREIFKKVGLKPCVETKNEIHYKLFGGDNVVI